MRKFLCAIIVATVVLAGCSASSSALGVEALVGTYAVSGQNPDGSSYVVEARIAVAEDGSADIEYFQDGQRVAIGVGLRTGNVLSLVYQTWDGQIGLASYRIEGDALVGTWKLPGVSGVSGEEFSRIPALTAPADEAPAPEANAPGERL